MSEKNEKKIQELAEKVTMILSFFKQYYPASSEFVNNVLAGVESAVKSNNLKGLKVLLHDMIDTANEFKEDEFSKLNDTYFKTFNENINDGNLKIIKKILKRSKLNSAEEYSVLLNYIDNAIENNDSDEIIKKGNDILSSYAKS